MNPLHTELSRLYRADVPANPSADFTGADLVDAHGRVRAMVLELSRPADWSALAPVWQAVQAELNLPAPAIAVTGVDGHQLWFALAEPIPITEARAFLEALSARYLAGLDSARIRLFPGAHPERSNGVLHAAMVPAAQPQSGVWSAFVAPDLAAIFSDEPWLELPPGNEAQAKVLANLQCTQPAAFQAALARLRPAGPSASVPATAAVCLAGQAAGAQPRAFLVSVMNDAGVDMHLRIEAAKALLPYYEG